MLHRLRFMVAVVLILLLIVTSSSALEMTPKLVRHVQKQAMKVLRQACQYPVNESSSGMQIDLSGKEIEGVRLTSGNLNFSGIASDLFSKIKSGTASFKDFSQVDAVQYSGFISFSEIQKLIDREISRLRSAKRIFDDVQVSADGKGLLHARGRIALDKIPGNALAFLSPAPAPFSGVFQIYQSGQTVNIAILSAEINGQPMTEELRTQVLNWLNPLWDYDAVSYSGRLTISPLEEEGIRFKGWLFAP